MQAGLVSAHARVVAYDHMEYNGGNIDIDATHGYATVLTQFLLLTVSVLYYQGLLEIQSAIANPFGNDATDLSRRREQRIWRAEVGALQEAALAMGESVIKYKSPLNVLKDTYDYSCY